jgi:UDPglucose 6-dehydrogenase
MTDAKTQRVAVVGLGKLGSPIAACLAAKGLEVFGVDSDPAKVEAVNRLEAPIYEPGLAEMLTAAGPRLLATLDLQAAVLATDVSLLIVPTPSDETGGFSLRFLLPALRTIGAALRDKHEFHTVVITSTVMPGATGGPIRELLEQSSGKRCGVDFGLCYSPEFVALGSVIKDFLNPDMVLIGQSDARAGDALESISKRVCESKYTVVRTTFANAEIAKLAVNTFVTTKITFANMLAGICQRVPGADVDSVTSALGLDSRIGAKYLKGAVAYGGPCFPRDNRALASLARSVGADAQLAEATDRANRAQTRRLVDLVNESLPTEGVVAVLGLAYKPQTDVIEQSQGLLLAQALADQDASVIVYDPAAMDAAKRALGTNVRYAQSLQECVTAADVIVVVTPWKEFAAIDGAMLARAGRPRTVIDCWRFFDATKIEPAARHVCVGVGPDEATALAEARDLRVA